MAGRAVALLWVVGLPAFGALVIPGRASGAQAETTVPTPRGVSPIPVAPAPGAPDTVPGLPAVGDSIAEPRLYLSWQAPFGMPRARPDVTVDCADTMRVDTLYLSFETGRDAARFYGMYARLYFHPAPGDTLGTWWHWERGWWNQGNMRVEFDPDGTFPCSQPWTRGGFGAPSYEFKPEFGTLDLVYAVKDRDAAPVAALTRYCFARVMLRHRKCALPGSDRPVCVEWSAARYSFGRGDVIVTRGGERFVSVNSPDGAVCEPYRVSVKPQRWLPRPPSPEVHVPVSPGERPGAAPDTAGRRP